MNRDSRPEYSVNISGKVVLLLPLLTSAFATSGCQRADGQVTAVANATPSVRVVEARAGASDSELALPARAQAGQIARLHARVSGYVDVRKVDIGDRVEVGDVLAVIDAPEVEQALHESSAQLISARAAESLAKTHADRANALMGTGAISKEVHSERLSAFEVASAAREAAEARLASARSRQSLTQIRAPFGGVISARSVEQGDRVVGDQASASALFELIALDPLRLVVDIPQSASMQIVEGTQAKVRFAELPGEIRSAVVSRRAQRISEDGGGMRVELSLPNPGDRIPAGMVGEAQFVLARTAPVVLVPISSVVRDAKGARVARVTENSTLEYCPVTLGRNLGSEIELLDGIAVGDRVVLSPNALIEDGSSVSIVQPATAR
jgi:RND family efflux transporter MFP subunit